MTEENKDYGGFYNSELFSDLFPDFEALQEDAAKEIWDRVLGRCGKDIGMPAIELIIDLGCGEGTLTNCIAKKIAAEAKYNIPIIGVDCSSMAITKALSIAAFIKDESRLQFLHHDGDDNGDVAKLFEWLTTQLQKRGVNWNRVALLCLSHTWFHFEQESLREQIQKRRPALLVIDIFHDWDRTVNALKYKCHDPGHGKLISGKTYWLKTEKMIDAKGGWSKVARGIWEIRPESMSGKWIFESTQYLASSADLFGDPKQNVDETQIFEKARTQGTLTGEDKCDYIRRKSFRHASGWGEMRCEALVPRDCIAAIANRAYFEVIQRVVKDVFVTNHEMARFDGIRNLLKLYDEKSDWYHAKFNITGSREALIVLPFDPHTSFARIVGLFENSADGEISRQDLILENPSAAQLRFPTAYGLFHTIEDRVSSPQAFPLHWAQDYEHAPIDKKFEKLEAALLGIWDDASQKNEGKTSFADGRDPSYFLLPIYFGSLPLFTLALKFPAQFPPEATNVQVYNSILANLHEEIKVALTDQIVRNQVVSCWIATALNAMAQEQAKVLVGKSIEDYIAILERLLFGQVKNGPSHHVSDECVIDGTTLKGGVVGKAWKSWVLSIPSHPIKNLKSVQAENSRLWNIWQEEKKRALMDHELRISHWFEQAEFFGDGAHEEWEDKIHVPLLGKMLTLTGANRWDFLMGKEAVKDNCYLKRSCDSYLLSWALN